MSGKKQLSDETFQKIASRLELDEEAVEEHYPALAKAKLKTLSFDEVAADQFQFISDWHYYAILEAVTLEGFDGTSGFLAESLGLTLSKTETAVARLVRLGHLKADAKGRIAPSSPNLTTARLPAPPTACREHERQVLQLAIDALEKFGLDQRDQSSLTLAIPASRMKEARKKIDEFRAEMGSMLQRRGKRDAVYNLSISFYPITSPKRK